MLWQDFRYAIRGLWSRPGFALLAITTLALGIGAATAIFSVIYGVLLDPFPYVDARRVAMVQIHDVRNSGPGGRTYFQMPEFLDYQEQSHVFSEVIGSGGEDVVLSTGEGTEQFRGAFVTSNMFQFLGVPPVLGRGLAPDDAKPDAEPVFVMAYKMWLAHYNRDPAILGQTFVLNGVQTRLVGIMPPRFTKLAADLYRPTAMNRADRVSAEKFFMFQARLKSGVTFAQAQAEMDVIAHRLAEVYPKNYPAKFTVNVVSWVDNIVGQFRKTLYTLAAAVGLLLLIACGNVANMLLARAASRQKEMAIRSSLGAGRAQLIRQLLVESFLLASGGAALGCLLAYGGIKVLAALIPDGLIPREAVIRLNVSVLVFSVAVAIVTALIFGLMPALHTAKRDTADSLRDSGKGVSGTGRSGRLRNAVVIAEVTLSLTLLIPAGLLMRSFFLLQRQDLGFDPAHVLVARVPLPGDRYKAAADKQQFFGTLLPRLQALPGVVAASETTGLPPYGGIGSDIEIPGKVHTEKWTTIFQLCSEGYARTLGLRLVSGRQLSAADVQDARKVAVVNQIFARRYFGGMDPIGQRVKIIALQTLADGAVADPAFEIIGVMTDAKNDGIQDPAVPEMLVPYTITGAFERGILVRTMGEPDALSASVRREIWAVDRNVALSDTGSLAGYMQQFSYGEPRFSLIVLSVFAGIGLVLVAVGVYSVIAYAVARRTHEIGIRMALGARSADVLGMVARMGLRLLAVGLVVGVLAGLGATRLIAAQLWSVSAHDPITLTVVVVMMVVVGLAATYFPARRAMRVNPVVALRSE
jgi:predicted permease